MLYIMTHQPQVTSQNYKSNTQLGKKCKSKTHYNLNPKLHVVSPATTYTTTLQIQTPNWVTITNPNTLQSKPQIVDLSQKYEIQIINNYSIRNFHKR